MLVWLRLVHAIMEHALLSLYKNAKKLCVVPLMPVNCSLSTLCSFFKLCDHPKPSSTRAPPHPPPFLPRCHHWFIAGISFVRWNYSRNLFFLWIIPTRAKMPYSALSLIRSNLVCNFSLFFVVQEGNWIVTVQQGVLCHPLISVLSSLCCYTRNFSVLLNQVDL